MSLLPLTLSNFDAELKKKNEVFLSHPTATGLIRIFPLKQDTFEIFTTKKSILVDSYPKLVKFLEGLAKNGFQLTVLDFPKKVEIGSYIPPQCDILTNSSKNCRQSFKYEVKGSESKKNCLGYCMKGLCENPKWLEEVLLKLPTKMLISGKEATILDISIQFETDKSLQQLEVRREMWGFEKSKERNWMYGYEEETQPITSAEVANLFCKWFQDIQIPGDKIMMKIKIRARPITIWEPLKNEPVEFPEFPEGRWFQSNSIFVVTKPEQYSHDFLVIGQYEEDEWTPELARKQQRYYKPLPFESKVYTLGRALKENKNSVWVADPAHLSGLMDDVQKIAIGGSSNAFKFENKFKRTLAVQIYLPGNFSGKLKISEYRNNMTGVDWTSIAAKYGQKNVSGELSVDTSTIRIWTPDETADFDTGRDGGFEYFVHIDGTGKAYRLEVDIPDLD